MHEQLNAFRMRVAEIAVKNKLNLSAAWREITRDLAANHYCCTCQLGNIACPCAKGLAAAKAGGDCACGLFHGHS